MNASRWPLYFLVNVCLIAAIAVGTLGIIRQNTRRQTVEIQAWSQDLDAIIASWESAGTPSDKRRLPILVTGDEAASIFDAGEQRSFLYVWTSWLAARASRAKHARLLAELQGPGPAILDWHTQGMVWAEQRRVRLRAIAAGIAKASRAQARITLVSDAEHAGTVLLALEEAGPALSPEFLVDKLILLGAFPGLPQPSSRPAIRSDKPAQAREWLSLWRDEDSLTSGMQFDLMGDRDRFSRQPLGKNEAEALAFVRGLMGQEASIRDIMSRSGELLATGLPASAQNQPGRPLDQGEPPRLDRPEAAPPDATPPADAASSTLSLDEPEYTLEYPKNWSIETASNLYTDIYFGATRWKEHRGSWAEISLRRDAIPYVRPPAKPICEATDIGNIQDYVNELDCDRYDPACKTLGPKIARFPIGGECGHYLKRMKLPLGQGYLFEGNLREGTPGDPVFNHSLRYWVLLYDIPGTKVVHRFEFWTTKSGFEDELPDFTKVVDSYRVKPSALRE